MKRKSNAAEDFGLAKEEKHRPSKRKGKPRSGGRDYTLSVALPGSILENAQSPELRTYLSGQIARALVVFNVDEVIVFNESQKKVEADADFKGSTKASNPNILLGRILQYLECPQYLRKHLFPRHPDLKYAGLLNPLDCPHHMRIDDESTYREGVVLDRPIKKGDGSFVNIGLRKEIQVDKHLQAGTRVTVKLQSSSQGDARLKGKVVSPSEPRRDCGLYWGYNVRLAPTFASVFTQAPYKDGYDVTIGTSERGMPVEELDLPAFRHVLVVFGGLCGLEASLESDESLTESDPKLLFDFYINSCQNQGSRTIRTEEALLITLSALRPIVSKSICS